MAWPAAVCAILLLASGGGFYGILLPKQRARAVQREEQAKIDGLLAKARENDDAAHGKVALAALEELLKLAPQHEPATQLRNKIANYYLPHAGDTFMLNLANGVQLEMVYLSPGEFRLGSTKAEREWALGPEGGGKPHDFNDEVTPMVTQISQGFWLGRTEVTVAQFRCFVWGSTMGVSWRNVSFTKLQDDHPVACVSWNDAMGFCQWARAKLAGTPAEGRLCRLPTEAE